MGTVPLFPNWNRDLYHYYTEDEVWFKWNTNKSALGLLEYGTEIGNLNLSLSIDTMKVEHHNTIPGLLKNQKYYYRVKAIKGEEEILSAVDSFEIKEEQPLDNRAPFVVSNWIFSYKENALLLFTINEPAIGELVYGKEKGVWTDTVRMERYKYGHVYLLEDLEANTVYYFELKLTDLSGNIGYYPSRNV